MMKLFLPSFFAMALLLTACAGDQPEVILEMPKLVLGILSME